MRKINHIVIHCSATMEGKPFNREAIRQMHLARGFNDIGYHYVILLDGTIQKGRGDDIVGAHVSGYNKHSIGVCYIGGIGKNGKGKDTRTPEQKAALKSLTDTLKLRYPGAKVSGHRDFSPDKNKDGKISSDEFIKECPCFDAKVEYA